MKTTRKGFTLIELIVVIAIIGVLAAILVPAMLGWVKKSKIQAANADAKTIMTNINAGLEEVDEEGLTLVDNNEWLGTLDTATNYAFGTATASNNEIDWANALSYVKEYSDTISTSKYDVYIKDGVAVCCVAKSGKYFGTYPASLTNKTYNKAAATGTSPVSSGGLTSSPTLALARAHAIALYNEGRTADATITP